MYGPVNHKKKEKIENLKIQKERREKYEREKRELRHQQTLNQLQENYQTLLQISETIYSIDNTADVEQPLVSFGDYYKTESIKDCLKTYFHSEFYDLIYNHTQYYVPKDLYNKLYKTNKQNDICVAQTTTLNFTSLTTTQLTKQLPSLINYLIKDIWQKAHKHLSLNLIVDRNQLYLLKYKPSIRLHLSHQGIFLEISLKEHHWVLNTPPQKYDTWTIAHYKNTVDVFANGKAFTLNEVPEDISNLTIQKHVYEQIQPWKQTHKRITEQTVYKENTWWNVETLPFVEPTPNTNLLYVTYIPHSNVIKIGRTQNWVSRKNTYRRNNGPTPETTGDMRLCYCYETPKTGDIVLDKWILYCAEDHLKQLAHNYMTLVAGQEFFKGYPVQNFCILVKNYFQTKSIKDIVAIRNTSDILQYALQNKYDSQRLIETINNL